MAADRFSQDCRGKNVLIMYTIFTGRRVNPEPETFFILLYDNGERFREVILL